MSLTISEADLTDERDGQAVLDLLQAYAADPMGGGSQLSDEVRVNLIGRLRQVDGRLVLLARVDGIPAGLAVAFPSFSTFRAAPVLNLHDLAVDPKFRGRGIGRALLNEVESYARNRGCCRVTLEVRRDNAAAQALYTSEGFSSGSAPQEFWTKPLAFPSVRTSTPNVSQQ